MLKKEKIILGQKISYVSYDSNSNDAVVVFLHGWGAKSEVFAPLLANIPNYRILDFPGFGQSGVLKTAWRLQDYAQITSQFIIETVSPTAKIILVGHSFGGRVLLKMLAEKKIQHPLEKIICIGVPFYRKKSLLVSCIEKVSWVLSFAPFFKKIAKKLFYRIFSKSDYESLGDNQVMKKTFQNIIAEEVSVYLPVLQQENVVFMWGEKDTVTPFSFAEQAKKTLPNARILSFKNAGHLPFWDEKEAFSLAFFREIVTLP